MLHDSLADMFSVIKNSESIGKMDCIVPASGVIRGVLKIMQQHNYIGKFDYIDDSKSGRFKIQLIGKINDCNVIKPRFAVQKDEFTKYEKRFLPADNVGILILATPKGIIDQREAKKATIGGKLLGYVF